MSIRFFTLYTALICWSLVAILPFASPIHYLPLPQWSGEILTVCLSLGAGFALVCNGALFRHLPRSALWCVLLAVCWALQPWLVNIQFPGMNYATMLAWLTMALLAAITFTLRDEIGLEKITVWLAWALLIGALVQVFLGFLQLSGLAPKMQDWLFYDRRHPTSNIIGHIGQRNQYAHYLMWGVVASVYLCALRRLKRSWFSAFMISLSIMLAASGSRTALLYLFAIVGISVAWHLRLHSAASRRLLSLMLIAVSLCVIAQFALPLTKQLLASQPWATAHSVSSATERLAGSDTFSMRRLAEMYKAWNVFFANPLWGIGWSQFAAESVTLQLLPQFAFGGVNNGLFTHSHNVLLQLLAEMGGIITALIIAGFVWVILPFFTHKPQIEGVLPLACLSITFIHSLLEYPLWYLYFLALFVLFMTLAPEDEHRRPRAIFIGWRLSLCAGIGALASLSWSSYHAYHRLVSLYTPTQQIKTDQQRQTQLINIINQEPLYSFHALLSLENYIDASTQNLNQLYWIERLAKFRPYPHVLLKQAQMQALIGQQDKAQHTLRKALASFPGYAPTFSAQTRNGPAAWRPLYAMSVEVEKGGVQD